MLDQGRAAFCLFVCCCCLFCLVFACLIFVCLLLLLFFFLLLVGGGRGVYLLSMEFCFFVNSALVLLGKGAVAEVC